MNTGPSPSSSILTCISVLTLPTSVRTVFGERNGFNFSAFSMFTLTGAHRKM